VKKDRKLIIPKVTGFSEDWVEEIGETEVENFPYEG